MAKLISENITEIIRNYLVKRYVTENLRIFFPIFLADFYFNKFVNPSVQSSNHFPKQITDLHTSQEFQPTFRPHNPGSTRRLLQQLLLLLFGLRNAITSIRFCLKTLLTSIVETKNGVLNFFREHFFYINTKNIFVHCLFLKRLFT